MFILCWKLRGKWETMTWSLLWGAYSMVRSKVKHTRSGLPRASLVVQCLRIRLPMQEARVQALVWEDPTCRRTTKTMRHNYWACALEPMSHNYWAHVPQLLKPACPEPMLPTREATTMRSLHTTTKSSPRSPQQEKSLRAATKTQRSQK